MERFVEDRFLQRGLIARGLGRSYGDAAQNAGGVVVSTTCLSAICDKRGDVGAITVEAGVSIDKLIQHLVPSGWFVPVTPGTRQVTVGGAIAADVHGKNHHRVGSWGNALTELTIVTPAFGVQVVSPASNADLFWATVGGMGLTGVILDATFRLQPIETSLISVDTDRVDNLDRVMSMMRSDDDSYDYSVAWVDLTARGRHLGRSVLDRGRFATFDQLGPDAARRPLSFAARDAVSFPRLPQPNLVTRASVRAFNEAWYRKTPKIRRQNLQPIQKFFHPLDMVDRWNRVYGRHGLVQWQCVVPEEASGSLVRLVEKISVARLPSFLAVLKRFGPGNAGHLSFPMRGWTLAMDLPAKGGSEYAVLLDELDDLVVACGGRLYLAKDSRMRPELLSVMYPRLSEWQDVQAAVDPEGRIASDLARRLHLTRAASLSA